MRQRPSRVPRVEIPPELRNYLDDLERKIPPVNSTATAAPAVTDDGEDGWRIGSRWYDLTNDAEYVCLDITTGAAVWKKTTP